MPTYEYGCTVCGNEWEEIQRITAPATEVCPKCGKTSAHRLISPGTGFILKGGGWYSDLYSSAGAAKKKDEGSSTAPSSESSSESGKKETPAAKTESTPASPTAATKAA